jgi:hypothetical protein
MTGYKQLRDIKIDRSILVIKGALLGNIRRRIRARPTRELRVSAEDYSRIIRVL